jgi:thioredoxin 1
MKKVYIKIGIVALAVFGTYTLLACNSKNNANVSADEQAVDLTAVSEAKGTGHDDKLSVADFEKLIKGEKLTMVDFYTTWCGPCKLMAPDVQKLKKTNAEMVNVLQIDAEAQVEIAGKYSISAYPTLMFFKKGQVIQTLVGARNYSELLEEVKKLK